MKFLTLILFLLSMFSFTYYDPSTKIHECISYEETQCSDGKMLICPPGYIDGCLDGKGIGHRCILKHEGPACALRINLECPVNFHDGCDSGSTKTHECIPDMGPLCEEQMKFSCPAGFQDACEI